jgi:hypothetical protein
VTYSSVLEEPWNLEIENQNIAAGPKNANGFFAPTVELEYGVTAWRRTAEAYMQGAGYGPRLGRADWLSI